jgi:hypothetical protein
MPNSNLVFDKNGNLFSTTYSGGTNNFGTLFELSPPANGQTNWTETVVHSFADNGSDGYWPQGNTIMTNTGNLLISALGGDAGGDGAIIQFTPPPGKGAWSQKLLYSFYGANGAQPIGMTLDPSGIIYGTTLFDYGVAFKVHP